MTRTYDITRPLTQVDVEVNIADLVEKLEEQTEVYAEATRRAAVDEARWQRVYHSAVLAVANRHDRPTAAGEREAAAHQLARRRAFVAEALGRDDVPEKPDLFYVHRITAAAEKAAKEALRATEAALSAQQTLLRSIAGQA